MKSDIFVEKIKKNSNFEFDLKCLDVDWPNTPFHNDYGTGNYDKIKEYYGEEYEIIKTESSSIDFEDMIYFVVKIFKDYPEILKVYQDRFHQNSLCL